VTATVHCPVMPTLMAGHFAFKRLVVFGLAPACRNEKIANMLHTIILSIQVSKKRTHELDRRKVDLEVAVLGFRASLGSRAPADARVGHECSGVYCLQAVPFERERGDDRSGRGCDHTVLGAERHRDTTSRWHAGVHYADLVVIREGNTDYVDGALLAGSADYGSGGGHS
jgi:hypothetical protein